MAMFNSFLYVYQRVVLSRKNHPVQTPDDQLTKALHRLAICPAGGQPQGRAALVVLGLAGAVH